MVRVEEKIICQVKLGEKGCGFVRIVGMGASQGRSV